jgi:hypothetical protein
MTDEAFPAITDVTDLRPERSMFAKRFPPPWRVEAHTESYVIRDAESKPVGYVYFAESLRQTNEYLLTRDGAWSVADNIANMPNLMMKEK